MNDQWEQIARSLRQRTRKLVSLRGLAISALVTVGLLWFVGLLDWALHFDAPPLRAALAAGLLAVIGATLWNTLWRPLRVRLSDVEIARSIERRFPKWGDELSSAAQFRTECFSGRLGSVPLQQTLTADVDRRLGEIDPQQVFDARPTHRLALIAAIVCAVGLGGALWQSSAAATVLRRLALPLAEIEWPRTTRLRFLDDTLQPLEDAPLRTAAGDPFAVYLENSLGELPEDVRLQLELADGRTEERTLQSTTMRDDRGQAHEVGIANLTAHEGPIRFRAVGGDDLDMSWRELEIVPPPALTDVSLTITPPAYTRASPQTHSGAGQVEALVGSRVQITAQANTPLSVAALRREGQPPQPMELSDGGRRVDVSFVVESAGHGWYWFDIADEHGLSPTNPSRYELRGIADRKPKVFVDQPASDVTLTPDADLPLRIIARDDLGVQALRLVYTRQDRAPEMLPLGLSGPLPTDETIEMHWNLSSLELTAGDRLTFHAEAIDAFDLQTQEEETPPDPTAAVAGRLAVRPEGEVGQVGLSAFRHIEILSSEDKQRELATRQLGILDTLRELQQQQSRAAESTAGLRIQSELAERLEDDDLDLLKQTELQQQQIREQLSDQNTGARSEVRRLRDELDRNQIDDPQLASRLDQLLEDLQTLTGRTLPQIEQSLARARKSSRRQADETRRQLRQAEDAQNRSLELLAEATEQLGGWQRQFEITSALDEMIADQSDIRQQTGQVGRQTLTKRPDTLTPQQQADLARLSDRQRRLAARLEQLLKQGTQTGDEDPAGQRPGELEAMQEALRELAKRQTAGHMHSAAESLRRNDIPQTAEAQQQVLSDLRQFGQLVQSGDRQADQLLLSNLQQQRAEVETLRKQQEQLRTQSQQALGPSADPDREQQLERLRRRQQELSEQADELARQLRRQQDQSGAQSAAGAARQMRQAQQALQQQQPQQTADAQRGALDDLERLAGELAQKQQQIERELARQQMEQLAVDLQDLADRQEALVAQTVDLDERQQERGSWSRSLRRQLRELTEEQSALIEQLEELGGNLSDYPVVELALQQAGEPMRSAAGHLTDKDTGPTTRQWQRMAHQRLLGLVDVIRLAQDPSTQPGEGQPPDGPPQDEVDHELTQIPQLLATQLRLLRHLQADVQQRTAELTEQIPTEPAGEDLQQQRQSLARDQLRIAELTRQLLQQFAEDAMTPEGEEQP